MTKVWGFGAPCAPLQFSMPGWRENARRVLQPGDRVVLVGTLQEPTALEDRGRVLGMVEPTTQLVASLDFVTPNPAVDLDEGGNYKWPYALLITRAWEFDDPPLLADIANRQFSQDAVLGIVPLTAAEEHDLLSRDFTEVAVQLPIIALARLEGIDEARRRGAPPPTTTRVGVMHMRRAPAFTYLMAVEGAEPEAYKVGWAFDYKQRLRQFNSSSLPSLGGLRFRAKLFRLWDTALQAYQMEQALLRHFDAARHVANREVIVGYRFSAVEAAWLAYLDRRLR